MHPIVKSRFWLLTAASGSTAGALLHVGVALSGRADWVAFFRAPAIIVQSMRDGGWIGPLSGLAIGGLMQIAGIYAFSATGLLPRLPLLRTALIVLATIGLLRGLLIPLDVMFHPHMIDRYGTFDWVAAAIWGTIGLCFAIGAVRIFWGRADDWRVIALSRKPCRSSGWAAPPGLGVAWKRPPSRARNSPDCPRRD